MNYHFDDASSSSQRVDSGSVLDALDRDVAGHRAAATPPVPDIFVHAVTHRRHTRWAVRAAVACVPLTAIVVIAFALRAQPGTPPAAPTQAAKNSVSSPAISPTPTAAELARVNRGRSGDALVLPETSGGDAGPVTAGTRLDSPAAAQIVK